MIAREINQQQVHIQGKMLEGYEEILSPDALDLLAHLHQKFNTRRKELLQLRQVKQVDWETGKLPDFLPETKSIRESNWQVAPIPQALQDRRVEITGPVDRKMIINALNSGAKVFMADFEDSTSPTWRQIIEGQQNLKEAVRKTISLTAENGKSYALKSEVAVLKVRPRGWHLEEKHLSIHKEPLSASLVDFALFMFHNAAYLQQQDLGPYFYLPKLENHLEARLWNDVFVETQQYLGIAQGSIKATVLIETILAAYEMEEILFELREHIDGLNAGRWDYIFSVIKKLRSRPDAILPDRTAITMEVPFMKNYAQLLVKTCHKRGAHAMGGMSAFIPSNQEDVNRLAFEKVRADKTREANQGYDGTWVAHPKLVSVAQEVFDEKLGKQAHQKHILREDVIITGKDLLDLASTPGEITEAGLRQNIVVALLYIESWLQRVGAAALFNLMEDAATAEISRAQLWQWIHHQAKMDNGKVVSEALYHQIKQTEMALLLSERAVKGASTKELKLSEILLDELVLEDGFAEFLTLKAYQLIS